MADARTITEALHGRWYGAYGLAFCPAHDNTRTPALSLRAGSDGRLLVHCKAGCDGADVLRALRGLGLLEGTGHSLRADPAAEARRRAEDDADRDRRIRQARRLWAEAQPIAGTLAERYLRHRGIRGALPASLRFCAQTWHGPSARQFPAMVAAVHLETVAEPIAVHRTYLAEPGRKADVAGGAKLALGIVGGGAVRLSEGAGPLCVAEGIETALSVLEGLDGRCPRVWAALSAIGMARLVLPSPAGDLAIFPDSDDGGTGASAARTLAARARAQGWTVRIIPAPPGMDWNDALQAQRWGACA